MEDWHIFTSPLVQAFFEDNVQEKVREYARRLIIMVWESEPEFYANFVNRGRLQHKTKNYYLDVVFYVGLTEKVIECCAESELQRAIA